jgi:hypothetical protein
VQLRHNKTGRTRALRRRGRQSKHRHENVAEAQHKQPHEPKATENKMGERDSAVVWQNASLFVDCQRHAKQGHEDKRGQRGPAIGSYNRQAAGAAQIVRKKHSEQQ